MMCKLEVAMAVEREENLVGGLKRGGEGGRGRRHGREEGGSRAQD